MGDVKDVMDGWEDALDLPELVIKQSRPNEHVCTKSLAPKVLIIGMNHAGSTTVAELMNLHPQMSFGDWKEHRFFTSTAGSFFRPGKFKPLVKKTVQKYLKEFNVPCDVEITFDATPNYWAMGNPNLPKGDTFRRKPGRHAVEEVQELLGSDVKIIWIAKDPVKWLSSNKVFDHPTWKPHAFKIVQCMAETLETWLSVFPKEQFLFLNSDYIFRI